MKAAVASQRAALFSGLRTAARGVTARRSASSRAVGVPVMAKLELAKTVDQTLPCIWPVLKSDVQDEAFLKEKVGPLAASWAKSVQFKGDSGKIVMVPGADGNLAGVLLGLGDGEDKFAFGSLPAVLPGGRSYRYDVPAPGKSQATEPAWIALAWALASYKFNRYKKAPADEPPVLVVPESAEGAEAIRIAESVHLGRDLINTPASDLGPAELEAAALALAAKHGAAASTIVGEDLLTAPSGPFPLIHAVGRASVRAPRLVDFAWGDPAHPKVTLVGKGVVFDTGGLDIKPPANMLGMKKDMGGAGAVLSLAAMIMSAKLPVRLRVLVPAVENSIDGNAFRPSDVIKSRKGLTVEIGNTDAEGRLILADALSLADEEKPEILIDMATLTGAHRVALGTDLPGVFTDDEQLAAEIAEASAATADFTWRLPLWKPYAKLLDSKIADTNSISDGPYGGAITAALFLQNFVSNTQSKGWVHIDLNGWTSRARPGFPEGGEPQGVRALFQMVKKRYGGATAAAGGSS